MPMVDVITAALAAGAAAGMQETASEAVRDAYSGLKDLLKRRLEGRKDAVQALEADETEPDEWQASIGDALVDSCAADDEQVLAAAQRLLELAAPDKAKTFNIAVNKNYGAIGDFSGPGPVIFNQRPPVPPASPAAS